jgi:type II secretory ATPase GspE/PulE/Tfp pilus assembly ATPase PilB-like protein
MHDIAGNRVAHEYFIHLNTDKFSNDAASAQQTVLEEWTKRYADNQGRFTLYRATGCDRKGYKGHVGLHELKIGTDKVKHLLQAHARVAHLLASALEDGMLTLKMDGIEKVLSGATDMKKVRVVCIK